MESFNGQAAQDYFVAKCLNFKRDGHFLEIGSAHPIDTNNSYPLEKNLNWKGLMIEYNKDFLPLQKQHRPNSSYIINDATKVDFKKELDTLKFPSNIDYLQIDLEVNNRSTLTCLENLDRDVFDHQKFALVTFEHDIYTGNHQDTRKLSREIFAKRGYVRVFSDVKHWGHVIFEDWYAHPDLVSPNIISQIFTEDSLYPNEIVQRLTKITFD